MFIRLCKFPPEILEKKSCFPKYKKKLYRKLFKCLFLKFIFWAWKVSSWNILTLGLDCPKSKSSMFLKCKKNFFGENIRNFFRVTFFNLFYLLSLGWKAALVAQKSTTTNTFWVWFSMVAIIWDKNINRRS